MQKRVAVATETPHCSSCMLGHVCFPVGMSPEEALIMDELVQERVRLSRGEHLYDMGDAPKALYAIRVGSIKTQVSNAAGSVQITGFHMPGEIVGMDGLLEEQHDSSAIAMEDSEVCLLPLDDADPLLGSMPSLHRQIRRLMSREITRSHQAMMTLGSLRSPERLATFLLDLSNRYAQRGYASNAFVLRMSREEIGRYLGLTLETVSRLFSRFAQEGVVEVSQRDVRILDQAALHKLAGCVET